jgi:hypothetical protein
MHLCVRFASRFELLEPRCGAVRTPLCLNPKVREQCVAQLFGSMILAM